jgi:hypothetical protein
MALGFSFPSIRVKTTWVLLALLTALSPAFGQTAGPSLLDVPLDGTGPTASPTPTQAGATASTTPSGGLDRDLIKRINSITAELVSPDNEIPDSVDDRYRPLDLTKMEGLSVEKLRPYDPEYKDEFEFFRYLAFFPLRRALFSAKSQMAQLDLPLPMAFIHTGHDDHVKETIIVAQRSVARRSLQLSEIKEELDKGWAESQKATDTTTGLPPLGPPPGPTASPTATAPAPTENPTATAPAPTASPTATAPRFTPPPPPPQRKEGKRWTAHYYFTLARLYSKMAWASEYNLALGQIRKEMEAPGEHHVPAWVVRPSTEKDDRDRWKLNERDAKKWRDEWQKTLDKIKADYPDTPWAILAKRELAIPLGVKVVVRKVSLKD